MKKLLAGAAVYLLPMLALAAKEGTINTQPVANIATGIKGILNIVVVILIGLAVLMVMIGIFRMVINASDEEARDAGKQFVVWGIIGIVIMLSVWGLVALLLNIFGGVGGGTAADVTIPSLFQQTPPVTGQ